MRYKITKSLKKTAAQEPAASMERWGQARLEETKARLEMKSPESFTADDHYETIDYLAQRYLPTDESVTDAAWQAHRIELRAKIDENIENERLGTRVPVVDDREERQKLLRKDLSLTLDEFGRIITPCLSRYRFAEDLLQPSSELVKNLWQATEGYKENEQHKTKWRRSDARDALIGTVHHGVVEAYTSIRSNYEYLLRARNAGYSEVRLMVPDKCKCQSSRANREKLSVESLIADVEGRGARTNLMVKPTAKCCLSETPGMCSMWIHEVEPLRPGDDPEFAAYLDDLLNSGR